MAWGRMEPSLRHAGYVSSSGSCTLGAGHDRSAIQVGAPITVPADLSGMPGVRRGRIARPAEITLDGRHLPVFQPEVLDVPE